MYKNRGMLLESIINRTIDFYKEHDVAIIHKKELPITFSGIKRNSKGKLEVKNGWIESKSTADYYGLYSGTFIAFEAKSTQSDLLNFSNIKDHQLEYLNKVNNHGGHGFFIIQFSSVNRFFIVSSIIFIDWIKRSININDLERVGIEIELQYPGIIDFLTSVDKLK